jgi:hypothetical protein
VANSFGDQPKAEMKDRGIRLEFRARHGDPPAERICGLVFIAPRAGRCSVEGTAWQRMWDGTNAVRLTFLLKTPRGVKEVASLRLAPGKELPLPRVSAEVEPGDEIVFLPRIDGAFAGGEVILRDVEIRLGEAGGE